MKSVNQMKKVTPELAQIKVRRIEKALKTAGYFHKQTLGKWLAFWKEQL